MTPDIYPHCNDCVQIAAKNVKGKSKVKVKVKVTKHKAGKAGKAKNPKQKKLLSERFAEA